MIDNINLAVPYFGLIFIGFACGKAAGLPESGLDELFPALRVAPGAVVRDHVENPVRGADMIRKSARRFFLATNAGRVCAEIMRKQ
jgi:hypothetical protein